MYSKTNDIHRKQSDTSPGSAPIYTSDKPNASPMMAMGQNLGRLDVLTDSALEGDLVAEDRGCKDAQHSAGNDDREKLTKGQQCSKCAHDYYVHDGVLEDLLPCPSVQEPTLVGGHRSLSSDVAASAS